MKYDLGNKLVSLRKLNKLTQEKVADELSVARQTISNWELNQTKPDLDQLKGLSNLYKISIDELVNNDIKDILTDKISNVEKLTGLVHKLLIGILVCSIIFVLLFIVDALTRVSAWMTSETNIYCSLNSKSYEIKISTEGEKEYGSLLRGDGIIPSVDDNTPVTQVEVSPLIAIPDLEKYDKEYQIMNVVFLFFESKGGSCY